MDGADAVDGVDADASTDGERDPEPTALEALRVTRRESRAVLDHQVALSNELDDRAVRTVRLAGVTLGTVVSVLGLAGSSLLSTVGVVVLLLVSLGVCSLLGCVLVGVGACSVSKASFGVDGSFRSDVVDGSYDEREWLRTLLVAYDERSEGMERVAARNDVSLLTAQLLLLLGVAFPATAMTSSVVTICL